jgi:hypothetical protein
MLGREWVSYYPRVVRSCWNFLALDLDKAELAEDIVDVNLTFNLKRLLFYDCLLSLLRKRYRREHCRVARMASAQHASYPFLGTAFPDSTMHRVLGRHY